MIGANHIDSQSGLLDLIDQFHDQWRVKEQDVGKIFLGMGHDGLPNLVVKPLEACVVLSKTIA